MQQKREFNKAAKTQNVRHYRTARGSDRYVAYWRQDGKQRSKTFRTKDAALRHLNKTRHQIDIGERPEQPTTITFGEWAEIYLRRKTSAGKIRKVTEATYRYFLAGSLHDWHDRPLRAITPDEIADWVGTIRNREARTATGLLSEGSVQKQFRLLAAILQAAVDFGKLPTNPAKNRAVRELMQGTTFKRTTTALSPAEVMRLADAVPEPDRRYRTLILVCGFTGLRWSEALALTEADVDLLLGEIHVTKGAVERSSGQLDVTPPKTKAGHRVVYLPPALQAELTRHIRDFPPTSTEAPIFTTQLGRMPRRSNFRRMVWLPALRRAGLPTIHFHDLRHAALTNYAIAGATLEDLRQIAGHANARMVMQYQQSSEQNRRIWRLRWKCRAGPTNWRLVVPGGRPARTSYERIRSVVPATT